MSARRAVVDPATGVIASSTALRAAPEYVRFVAATGELWVTEPNADQTEIFKVSSEEDSPGSWAAQGRVPRRRAEILSEMQAQRARRRLERLLGAA